LAERGSVQGLGLGGEVRRIESYEALVDLLRTWRSWSGDGYDVGGMMHLLGACLDNLKAHALEAELDELAEFLEPAQVEFLRGIVGESKASDPGFRAELGEAMDLRNANFRIAGLTSMTFQACMDGLWSIDKKYHLWRFLTWDDEGQPNTTICDPGTSIYDFDGILIFDAEGINTASGEYDVFEGCPRARVAVDRRSDLGKLRIDGFLPVGTTITRRAPDSPLAVLQAYADFATVAAHSLEADVLVVAGEYCETAVGTLGLPPPSVLVISPEAAIAEEAADLIDVGALIEEIGDDRVRVWIQPPEQLAAGSPTSQSAHDAMGRMIANLSSG